LANGKFLEATRRVFYYKSKKIHFKGKFEKILLFLRENIGKFWLEPFLKMVRSEPILAQNA